MNGVLKISGRLLITLCISRMFKEAMASFAVAAFAELSKNSFAETSATIFCFRFFPVTIYKNIPHDGVKPGFYISAYTILVLDWQALCTEFPGKDLSLLLNRV